MCRSLHHTGRTRTECRAGLEVGEKLTPALADRLGVFEILRVEILDVAAIESKGAHEKEGLIERVREALVPSFRDQKVTLRATPGFLADAPLY